MKKKIVLMSIIILIILMSCSTSLESYYTTLSVSVENGVVLAAVNGDQVKDKGEAYIPKGTTLLTNDYNDSNGIRQRKQITVDINDLHYSVSFYADGRIVVR